MKALLLAAGFGTRLRPLTLSVPKCLVPISGVPLIDFWLDLLFDGGVKEVLINTHYLHEQVQDHINKTVWKERIRIVHEPVLLGTGGTILANRAFFDEAPFMVAHADNLALFDLNRFVDRHRKKPQEAVMTMMTFRSDTPWTCGIVVEDSRGLVRAFHEKVQNPPDGNANGAVYIFDPSIFEVLTALEKKEIDLSTEVLPLCIDRIATFFNDGYLRDIGSPESLSAAAEDFRTLPAFQPFRQKLDGMSSSVTASGN